MLKHIPSIPTFFHEERMLNSVKVYMSIEMIIWFLFLVLFMLCVMLIVLWILNQPSIPEMKATQSWCMILKSSWIQFARVFFFENCFVC